MNSGRQGPLDPQQDYHPRPPRVRTGSSRSRRQRLAAGAVLATTGLLGTYLAALRPQPTYAASLGQSATQQARAGAPVRPAVSAPSISTCADAAPQDVVSDDTELRAAILRSQDDSVICIDGLISLHDTLPVIDDTTLTLVGDDSTTDGIDGRDLHRLVRADLTGGGDDTVYLANLGLSNGYGNGSDGGGAVLADGGGLVISGSTLSSNSAGAQGSGGGIYSLATNVIIEGSVFQGNDSAAGNGGAALFQSSVVAMTETTFTDNEATYGAAVAALGSTLTASTVSISENQSSGAISLLYSSLVLSNSFVGRNSTLSGSPYTGGIFSLFSGIQLVFTTVYDNAPGSDATDVFLSGGSGLVSVGSLVGNSTDDTPSIFGVSVDDTYSVATGPGAVFDGLGSRNVAGGTLGLGTGALTGTGSGRPGLSPAPTSVLVTGAPTSDLNTGVDIDQLGNPRPALGGTTWTIGARQVTGNTPPVFPPSAPRNVTAEPGDGKVTGSWDPPTNAGSFPVTNYRVIAEPGGASCLVSAPATSCVIQGLTNGQPYTFRVEALNGAGWGPLSPATSPVTPESACPQTTITLDHGTRTTAGLHDRVTTDGTTTCITEGARLTPHIRYSGTASFIVGKATITVQADGTFRWSRLVKKSRGLTAYVSWQDTKSNKQVWVKIR